MSDIMSSRFDLLSTCDDLHLYREKLLDSLGDKSKLYTLYMKMWFQMKITKEKFDIEVRKLLDPRQTRMHNEFLLRLFLKCSKPELPTNFPSYRRMLKAKRRGQQSKNGFQQTNVQEYAPTRITQRFPDDPQRYCTQELLVPDSDLIHMRLMLAGWELGLKGADRGAADMLVIAARLFIKNIISTVVSRRNGFRLNARGGMHSIGVPVPNPWLRNTSGILGSKDDGPPIDMKETGENVPGSQPSLPKLRQDIALTYASSFQPAKKRPITGIECFEALQVYRRTILSHGVSSINIERIANRMSHPSWDQDLRPCLRPKKKLKS